MTIQRPITVTEQAQEILAETIKTGRLGFLYAPPLRGRLIEAVLNVKPGSEDAPELVLIYEYLAVEDVQFLIHEGVFGMTEATVYGGRLGKGQNHKSCVELSGYVDPDVWTF